MSRRLDRGRSLLRRRLTGRGVTLAVIGLATLALAAVVGWEAGRGRRPASIRPLMASFRPIADGGDGYGSILADAARGEAERPDFDRILPAARAAAEAARRIEGNGPDGSGPDWDRLASSMRDAALDLERACEQSDAGAAIVAARRLDASCVQCHAAFRKPADVDVRVSFRPRRPDAHRTARPEHARRVRSADVSRSIAVAGTPRPSRSAPNDSLLLAVIRMGFPRVDNARGTLISVAACLSDRRSVDVATHARPGPWLSLPC